VKAETAQYTGIVPLSGPTFDAARELHAVMMRSTRVTRVDITISE